MNMKMDMDMDMDTETYTVTDTDKEMKMDKSRTPGTNNFFIQYHYFFQNFRAVFSRNSVRFRGLPRIFAHGLPRK